MKYYIEESLQNFNAWSGGKDTMNELTPDEIDTLESYIEELSECGEMWSDTEINDFLWFERDTIAEYLGFEDWEDLERKHAGEDDEEEDEEEEEEEEDDE